MSAFADAVAVVVAHQGGWDEILMIAAPLVIVAFLLWVAKRRVDAARVDPPGHEPDE